MDIQIDIDRQMDMIQIDRWIYGYIDRYKQIDGQMDRWMDKWIDGQIVKSLNGQMDRWTCYIYRYRQIDRQMSGKMDRQIDAQIFFTVSSQEYKIFKKVYSIRIILYYTRTNIHADYFQQ